MTIFLDARSNLVILSSTPFYGHVKNHDNQEYIQETGTKSVIFKGSISGTQVHLVQTKSHSISYWQQIRGKLFLQVSDGKIEIKNSGTTFIAYQDSSIKKNELKSLLVSGAWGSKGTVSIDGVNTGITSTITSTTNKTKSPKATTPTSTMTTTTISTTTSTATKLKTNLMITSSTLKLSSATKHGLKSSIMSSTTIFNTTNAVKTLTKMANKTSSSTTQNQDTKKETIEIVLAVPLKPIDLSSKLEVMKTTKGISIEIQKELQKFNPFKPKGIISINVKLVKKYDSEGIGPASANVKIQYSAPIGTKQVHDSKTINARVTKLTKSALSVPAWKFIVDQTDLKTIKPKGSSLKQETNKPIVTTQKPLKKTTTSDSMFLSFCVCIISLFSL